MRTEQLQECLAAICVVHGSNYVQMVGAYRQVAPGGGKKGKAQLMALVILTRFMAILTGDYLSYHDNC